MNKKTNKNISSTKISDKQLITGGRVLQRHRDFFTYLIFGFLASLINILVYFLMQNILGISLVISNTIAFFIANLFSFFMNKHAVFTEDQDTTTSLFRQIVLFFLFRILSLIPDNLVMLLGLSFFQWNELFVKILDQILVGIFNYLTTRAIFKKQTSKLRRQVQQVKKDRKHLDVK